MSQARDYASGGEPIRLDTDQVRPAHVDLEAQSPRSPVNGIDVKSPTSPTESLRFRKVARSNTAKTYRPEQRGQEWRPGQEPGIDVSVPHGLGSQSHLPQIYEQCDITVVDFSPDEMKMHHLDNRTLGPFLRNPRPAWADCRWINVDGLSWDVIEVLGKDKNLHRLAIEDLMNPRNRTKADWYSDHTYMVLPLQKLIHYHPDSDSDSESSGWDNDKFTWPDQSPATTKKRKKRRGFWPFSKRKRTEKQKKQTSGPMNPSPEVQNSVDGLVTPHMSTTAGSIGQIRTLQRYHGGPNEERIVFMEKHSALASKGLGVGVEQVSIFLTSDNTVISFFEGSAEDVDAPLIKRLSTPETILRRCSDASMITQVP